MRGAKRWLARAARKLGIRRRPLWRGPRAPLPPFELSDDVSSLRLVEADRRPYDNGAVKPASELGLDDDGLQRYERDGRPYFHPVRQTQLALACLDMFRQTGERPYLDIAVANAEGIVAKLAGDYLPYGFDFPLHGNPRNTIHATWFSGMAQGQFLSLVSRLARETGTPEWRALADRMYDTLADVQAVDRLPGRPWVTFVDADGMLWFEEYSGDVEPMRVLNGHLFAMFGVYDYWQLTRRRDVEKLFAESAKTVLRAIPRLRVPGEASWYGLRIQNDPIAQSEGYHLIHVSQLRYIAAMTGDERFSRFADALESDVPTAMLPLPLLPLLPKLPA